MSSIAIPPKNTRSRNLCFTESQLPGCFSVQFPAFEDDRGLFVKTVQRSAFERQGLRGDFVETFHTVSNDRVLRGMHFQVPPVDHAKLVYCVSGAVWDVALDLRVGSPTFGEHAVYELSVQANNAVYLPSGIAHGFVVLNGPADVMYHVTSEHDPVHDQGVLWSSFGAPWPGDDLIISARDRALIPFAEFESPFRFEARQ
ncbi:dTDP-4-dehydrorhamnose 3,5-epimerase [Granulicella pectinivorans]|uniref:dTDP-4-dehydrorhamnose 3,5-epimerase n=1 Tax=Granulicella pectinivorans TaxID=474950 RepID=A0A1I6L0H0_9BACT|nr:dTDP-4-dehydrorhamnose 3,5-epimerase family protein [Granulicella pectinivorans]SFR96758.1 dTDP-4-dehydrorhamnose 3,5-epimerase [Granulicella pectinivorans]